MYFLISNSDGDTYVEVVDIQKLLKDINNGDYGKEALFLDNIPTDDANYWPEGSYLLIEGDIKTLKPKEVITEYVIG